MMRFGRTPPTRRGFAMILLAIAAASVCTVTVSTMNAGSGYELQSVKQLMRNEQSRWLLESFNELGLARQCAPPWPGPGPEPQLFAAPYRFKPYMMGFTGGANAETASPERIQVTFSTGYAVTAGPTYSQDVQIRMYNDIALTKPTVELELNRRNVALEPGESNAQREAVRGTQRRTAWKIREANALP